MLVAAAAATACPPASALTGIQKIQHVVMITQENRSFDHYFGTYPGADGIPAGVCVPDPAHGNCVAPFHDQADVNYGGPHHLAAFQADYNSGHMDGFVSETELSQNCTGNPNAAGCSLCNPGSSAGGCLDVMGYHDAREIPNYWTYAQNYTLQDHMYESVRSWSLPAHLYQVSAWSAQCTNSIDPTTCGTFINQPPNGAVSGSPFPWTDITWLLHKNNVSWGYYIFNGTEPDCENDAALTCAPVKQGPTTPGIWNPLPYFSDVKQDGQTGNVQSLNNFYTAAGQSGSCGLPNVSWIVPNDKVSEHPPSSVAAGQAFVTTTVNTIMRSSCWNSTAIFVSWDDWGGFYDHVAPPTIPGELGTSPATPAGYGFRVPGIVISPYAKTGYIDHQTLSPDAYLKFIEDDFLGGARLDPTTDGRPDPRPDVRENASILGNLASDFNFAQSPRPPLLLPTHPAPGPASCPPGGSCSPPPPKQPKFLLNVSTAAVQHVRGRHPSVKLVVGCTVACSARVGATLSIKQHRRYLTLSTRTVSIPALATRKASLALSRQNVKAILKALRHRRVTLTIRMTVQATGVTKRYSVKIRLRR